VYFIGVEPAVSYLVCATPRSGSTLLCHLLEQTGVAGRPEEYFEALRHSGVPRRPHEYFDAGRHPDIVDRLAYRVMPDGDVPEPSPLWSPETYGEYLRWALDEGTTPNGVFGAKLMWGYLNDFAALLCGIDGFGRRPVPQLLDRAFPNLRYIRVTREDKIRQAVSLWKAVQTQAWNSEAAVTAEPQYDAAALRHLRGQLIAHDAAWVGYFTGLGVEPLVVTYEELAEAHEPVIRRVLDHLGIGWPEGHRVPPPRLQVQADEMSEDWVRRFESLALSSRGL
jgi:LPS sulfotransferase NodH